MNRPTLASVFLLSLGACAPRTPPSLPEPEPPPAEAAPEPAAAERARSAWEDAILLGRQGRWPEAEGRLREAVRLQPEDVTYHMALANALIQLGRHSAAADALWTAIRIEERGVAPNHRVLAMDYDRLIDLLERVNRLDEARTARARQAEHRRLRDRP